MIRRLLIPLASFILGTSAIQAAPDPITVHWYVAPGGKDTHDGKSPERAFATLTRARDAIRQAKNSGALPRGGVAVEILGGAYTLAEPLALTSADSGAADAPVVYRAFQNQSVQLLGGRILPLAAFKPVTDAALLARLDPAARGQVLSASIAQLGLSHSGPFPPVFSDSGGIFELFWNGQRLPLSRWPNEGWTTMARVLVNGDKSTPGVFEYRDDRPARWTQNSQIWLKGQWRVGWEDPAIRVDKIDPAARTITFAHGLSGGIGNKYTRDKTGVGPGNGKEPWCALNLMEEIDRPGEWAIDFDTGTLFFWPPAATGELIVSQLDQPMITGEAVSNVRLIGLTFQGALGDGVAFENADAVLIQGCTFFNLAKNGVILHGRRSVVQSCDLSQLGAGGVLVSGGDKASLTPSGNVVVNNHIHDYGVLKAMYSAAVNVGFGGINAVGKRDAVGIRVANNLIHDAPRDAVLVSGQNNLFEFNEIYRCGFASADVGAFYSWLDWTIRGVVIRYNYIHDTVGGVNPDDGASGSTVFGNVFVGPRTGVWIASGPDHVVENNIFVKDEGPVFGMDDRGAGRGYATNPKLIKGVEAINPAMAPWVTRFPEMKTLLADHPELPLRTRFVKNLIVMQQGDPVQIKFGKAGKSTPGLLTNEGNWVTPEDPGFVNAAAGDFALKPNSPAFAKIPGFKPIPFEKIGLFTDEFRRALPTPDQTRRPKPNSPNPDSEKNFGT